MCKFFLQASGLNCHFLQEALPDLPQSRQSPWSGAFRSVDFSARHSASGAIDPCVIDSSLSAEALAAGWLSPAPAGLGQCLAPCSGKCKALPPAPETRVLSPTLAASSTRRDALNTKSKGMQEVMAGQGQLLKPGARGGIRPLQGRLHSGRGCWVWVHSTWTCYCSRSNTHTHKRKEEKWDFLSRLSREESD